MSLSAATAQRPAPIVAASPFLDNTMRFEPPRHIVWSTTELDIDDPFQRQYYIRQVLLHGRAEDIRTLDLGEVARLLPELRLPTHVHSLWERYFEESGRAER